MKIVVEKNNIDQRFLVFKRGNYEIVLCDIGRLSKGFIIHEDIVMEL